VDDRVKKKRDIIREKQDMKFSIITSTLNSANTICLSVASVNGQTYPDIEHIIIDGASTDNTLEKIHSEPNRIAKVISEPDGGIYEAINKGILNSTGDIIGILHSDDVFGSDTIMEEIGNRFVQNSADIVYGDLVYVSSKDNNRIIRLWKSKPFERSLITKGWMPPHPTMFIKRDVFLKYGLYDLRYRISSDYDLILRLMKEEKLKFDYLPDVVTRMRLGGVSNNRLDNILQKSTEDYRIIRKHSIPFPAAVLFRKNISKLNQFFTKR
jgi:glycosyltransferase involved in cell wall biosynthesis